MRPIKLLLLLLTFGIFGFGSPIASIVKDIADRNVYEATGVGYNGVRTEQFARYEQLLTLATDHQLITLLEHSNAVVRVYAYRACKEKGVEISADIESRFSRDHNKVRVLVGCEGFISSVADLTAKPLSSMGTGASSSV